MISIDKTVRLTKKEQLILDWIMEKREQVLYLTEYEISSQMDVSTATISRFWRKIGFQNFKEFKFAVRTQLQVSPIRKFDHSIKNRANFSLETFATETSVYLSETVDRNDDGMLADVIHCIARSTNLYVYANGPALSCASLLAFRLHRYGIHVHVINETGHA
ncbi:MAG: MurR/RpiR family transcriptional regulator, partial [Bacilli bacterium]